MKYQKHYFLFFIIIGPSSVQAEISVRSNSSVEQIILNEYGIFKRLSVKDSEHSGAINVNELKIICKTYDFKMQSNEDEIKEIEETTQIGTKRRRGDCGKRKSFVPIKMDLYMSNVIKQDKCVFLAHFYISSPCSKFVLADTTYYQNFVKPILQKSNNFSLSQCLRLVFQGFNTCVESV